MRSFLLSLLSLLLGCYLLATCSSSTDTVDAVRIRWSNAPNTLDPLRVSKPQELEVINLLHCSLLVGEPHRQQIMPWLAQSMPTVGQRGALTLLTYQLRPEATWDNGQPVLAHDVAFTLRVLNCPGLPTEFARALYGFVLDIELDAADPRRFTLVCSSSSSETIFASGDYSILPEYALDPTGTLRAVPLALLRTDTVTALLRYPALRVFATRYRQAQLERHPERLPGCGPYQLAAWESNRYLSLQRKPQWWADRVRQAPTWLQAHALRLNYQIIPDNATALLALRRGNIDIYPMPPARDFNRLRQSADTSQLAFHTANSYEMTTAGFNTQNLLLRDHRTRQALRFLFNIPDLIQATHAGLAYPSVSLISPQDTPAYNDSLTVPSFSPSKAEELLQEAGWQKRADGNWWRGEIGPLALSVSYRAEIPEHETVALQFRAAAASTGILVRLRP
ncbi:MAG TPA: ABC transporter substrate-binding protein, partial [Hymenobacter sp.]|nr:ABC transporter substrate-binding protein [Hymenobacter sp.]